MVRNFRIVDDYIYLRLYIGYHQHQLQLEIESKLSSLSWCKKTYIQICTISGVKTTLGISSGKGGVGKSTTAVNIAAALKLQGAKVGLLDADVYGPNIPQMLHSFTSFVLQSNTSNTSKEAIVAKNDYTVTWQIYRRLFLQ